MSNLELGKYLESDMIELTEDDVEGGWTPAAWWAAGAVATMVSSWTCPTSACTRAC